MRLLTYNIHKGFASGSGRFVLERMRERIRSVDAEVVFLQEVLGEHHNHAQRVPDWPVDSQFEYLADSIWPHFSYGKNAIYSAGHHGNAILSKYPFLSEENLDISNNRFERRGLLHGTVEIPGWDRPLHLICLHLDLLERGRLRQGQRLCERIEGAVPPEDPLVIAGDFNDWRGSLHRGLTRRLGVQEAFEQLTGRHARTFPSFKPVLCLDRIYLRGLEPRSAVCLDDPSWDALSDHRPLFAEVQR